MHLLKIGLLGVEWVTVRRILVFTAVIALFAAVPLPAFQQKSSIDDPWTLQDFNAGDAAREPYQRATELLKATEVSSGAWVADVGVGAGYYSMRLSTMVGPAGKVFAEDISDSMLRFLRRRIEPFSMPNVQIVKGDPDNPKLPAASLAAVLVVNAYHHFADYAAMKDKIFARSNLADAL